MPLHVSSTVVLIIRRSKLYYTASGIITTVGGSSVRRLREAWLECMGLQVRRQVGYIRRVPKNVYTLCIDISSSVYTFFGTLCLCVFIRIYMYVCIYIYIYIYITHLTPNLQSHAFQPVRSQPAHVTATYRCDDTRCCIIQFLPPVDEHIVLETCRGV